MSAAYVALGVFAVVLIILGLVGLLARSQRARGRVEAGVHAADKVVADVAVANREAADVRSLPGGDAAQRLRRDWSR